MHFVIAIAICGDEPVALTVGVAAMVAKESADTFEAEIGFSKNLLSAENNRVRQDDWVVVNSTLKVAQEVPSLTNVVGEVA